jgi:hypothetical protein
MSDNPVAAHERRNGAIAPSFLVMAFSYWMIYVTD